MSCTSKHDPCTLVWVYDNIFEWHDEYDKIRWKNVNADSQEVNTAVRQVPDTQDNDVVIILEWNEEDYPLFTFNVSSEPPAQQIINIESSQVQLVLYYDTVYNVTVVGSLCGSGRVFTTLELNYTKDYMNCSSPSNVTNASVSSLSLRYGDNVDLSCPPGLVLTGPNTTTCMEDGEWEPDPSDSTCKG